MNNCICKKKKAKQQIKQDYKFLKELTKDTKGEFFTHSSTTVNPYNLSNMKKLLHNMGLHLRDNGRFLYARKEVITNKNIYILYVNIKFINTYKYKLFFDLTKTPYYKEDVKL